jgi:hypothetical protein
MELEDLRRRLKEAGGDAPASPGGSRTGTDAVAPVLPISQGQAAQAPQPTPPAEPQAAYRLSQDQIVSSPGVSAAAPSPARQGSALTWLALVIGSVAFAFAFGSYLGLPNSLQGLPADDRLGFLQQRAGMTLLLLGGVALLLCLHALGALRQRRAASETAPVERATNGAANLTANLAAADIAATLAELRQAARALAERPPVRPTEASAAKPDAAVAIEAAIRGIETSLAARLDNVLATVATRTQALNGHADEIERASRDLAAAARSAELVLFPALREVGEAPVEGPLATLADRLDAAVSRVEQVPSGAGASAYGGVEDVIAAINSLKEAVTRIEQAPRDPGPGASGGTEDVIAAIASLKDAVERRALPTEGLVARVEEGALLPLVDRIDGLAERVVSLTLSVEEARDPGPSVPAAPVEVDLGPLAHRIDALAARIDALAVSAPERGERSDDRSLAGLSPRMTALAATIDQLSETVQPRLDALKAAVDDLAARPAADTSALERAVASLTQDVAAARTTLIGAIAVAVEPLKPSLEALRGGMADVLARMDGLGADGTRTRDALVDALATLQARVVAFDEAFGPKATLARLDEIGAQVTTEARMSRLAADGLAPQLRSQEAMLDVVRNQGDRLLASIESLSREVAQASSALSVGERAGAAGLAGLAPAMAEALPRIENGIADLVARITALQGPTPR